MKWGTVFIAFGTAAVGATGTPHKVERKSAALDFSYEWPAEAAAIPALDLKLYTEARKALAEAQKYAREDEALARQQKRDFNPHYYAGGWETVGKTARLLSLEGSFGTFTGGAHPNTNYRALLWDRRLNRELGVDSLFVKGGDFGALTRAAYCQALDRERLEKREGEKLDGEFSQCPKYSELAIAPLDKDKDGRFDAIDFTASPYVAGPYVEGEYEIEVPISVRLIAALKTEYRGAFEVQRQ